MVSFHCPSWAKATSTLFTDLTNIFPPVWHCSKMVRLACVPWNLKACTVNTTPKRSISRVRVKGREGIVPSRSSYIISIRNNNIFLYSFIQDKIAFSYPNSHCHAFSLATGMRLLFRRLLSCYVGRRPLGIVLYIPQGSSLPTTRWLSI